jgi:NAD(P)-dependent dehydrogenase (short-subunit alcohol dehydrogenase family)
MRWLITGCSPLSLGYHITVAALQSGQSVIATTRNPSKHPSAAAEIENIGGVFETLDIRSQTLEDDIRALEKKHGDIDVLVNNAGVGIGGVFEAMSYVLTRSWYHSYRKRSLWVILTDLANTSREEDSRAVMDTNFRGPVRAMQTLIPGMRDRKSGIIVNVSSSIVFSDMAGTSFVRLVLHTLASSIQIKLTCRCSAQHPKAPSNPSPLS